MFVRTYRTQNIDCLSCRTYVRAFDRDSCHQFHAYKIVVGLVNNATSELFTLANTVNAIIKTRGYMYKLFPHHDRVDARKYFSLSELYAYGTVYQQSQNI